MIALVIASVLAVATAQRAWPTNVPKPTGVPRVTFPHVTRPHVTRPVGPGGFGGCPQQCASGEVCMLDRQNQQCIQALENRTFPLPTGCMTCQSRGTFTLPTRPSAWTRPTRPAFTRPAHYTHQAGTRSCARWNTASGAIQGGVHDAATCSQFCSAYQNAQDNFTDATASKPAACCCTMGTRQACCDVTDVAPTGPGGVTEPVSAECPFGSALFTMCSGALSTVSLECSAKVSLANNCDVFAPPGSDAFNDCEAIYDCVTGAYANYTKTNRYFNRPFETCCPCIATLGGQVPGDQWMDDFQCSANANGNGDDDDAVTPTPK